jgi:uncharacterized membrane protein
VLAVNVGGAVIPTLLSCYLLVKTGMYGRALVGVTIVTAVVHGLASPVKGVGIAVPLFIPPVVAAATALLLSRQSAPSLAYISGSLETLIGADLLNLGNIQALGAPIASICSVTWPRRSGASRSSSLQHMMRKRCARGR